MNWIKHLRVNGVRISKKVRFLYLLLKMTIQSKWTRLVSMTLLVQPFTTKLPLSERCPGLPHPGTEFLLFKRKIEEST